MIISKNDSLYPELLRSIPDPPETLNIVGTATSTLFKNCIAFVGSRKMSPYGQNVVAKFIADLTVFTCSVVSGFTRGVDNAVHQACLNYSVPTIAVLPFGLDYKLPTVSAKLIQEITQNGGAVISEYSNDFEPQKWSFVKRNRIIAGISLAVVVVEAAKDSGSLITAHYAQKYGRPVYVVPGSIFSPLSEGIYQLMNTCATCVISGRSVGKILDLPVKSLGFFGTKNPEISREAACIVSALSTYPMDAFSLSSYIKMSIHSVTKNLLDLTAAGQIYFKDGLYFCSGCAADVVSPGMKG